MKYFYLIWAVAVFILVFVKDGPSVDTITHSAILIFFFGTLAVYYFQKNNVIKNPKFYFISRCIVSAAVVEGCYMISKPVLPSLQIIEGMSAGQMLQNYCIDLLFTVPAYVFIFYVIWWLINRYEYTFWEFAIVIAFGQALGDGGRTFLLHPALIFLVPYVMINYHAMNVVPYLNVRNVLPVGRIKSAWRYIMPIVLIPATYLVSGVFIYTIAAVLKLQ